MTQAESRTQTLSLRDLIGGGYDEWFYDLDPSTDIYKDGMTKSEWAKSVRYWIVKGSRHSKKSFTIAYWILIHMMQFPWGNTLVVRKVDKTLRHSCYALLKKCMAILGVRNLWKCNESTLEMTYLPTGQKILFSGLDDSQKLSSLQVEHGVMCWLWVEEAYQINSEEEFDKLDQSFRGKLPEGAFIRIMLSLNPWNRTHWIRTKFFETDEGTPLNDPDIYAHTTNYLINEWASETDIKFFERMKRLNPRQYEVAGLGKWGSPEGLIYDGNWEEFEFDFNAVARRDGVVAINGLDFGFSADPTALCCMLYDEAHYELYIYDELYVKGYTSQMRYDAICEKGHKNSVIYYDSAGALDSAELMELGMSNLIPYNKAGEKNSILNGINFLRSLKIYVHPRCVNFLIEIENYMWYVDKDGITQNKPQPGSMDHLMDAMRYGVLGYRQSSGGGYIGESDESAWQDDYQYPLMDEEEIEQRKKDVAVINPKKEEPPKKQEEDDDDDDDGLSWCYST